MHARACMYNHGMLACMYNHGMRPCVYNHGIFACMYNHGTRACMYSHGMRACIHVCMHACVHVCASISVRTRNSTIACIHVRVHHRVMHKRVIVLSMFTRSVSPSCSNVADDVQSQLCSAPCTVQSQTKDPMPIRFPYELVAAPSSALATHLIIDIS